MNCTEKFLILFCIVVTTTLIWLLSKAEVITLHATESIPVGINPVEPIVGSNLVAIINKDETAEVISCEDIKTNQVILVRLKTGSTGYVTKGKFFLERQKINLGIALSRSDAITFSCAGFFNSYSQTY